LKKIDNKKIEEDWEKQLLDIHRKKGLTTRSALQLCPQRIEDRRSQWYNSNYDLDLAYLLPSHSS
jgi:hypothetical protein